MEYLLAFNAADIVNFKWKTDEGEAQRLFLNLCFLTVLESSVDEVWWSGAESLI